MMSWLDRVTGRVTMYRLITIVLALLALVAIQFSITGQIFYTPTAIVLTGVVAIAATFVSSVVFAAIFRTRAHLESSVITGLLLLFLFRPTIDVAELGTIALAGAIAGASKFLLAIRRRHVFNPAAIGALIVSLLGLNFAAWWIATPPMLPFVAVAAFLVLARTHRLAMGLLYVALSAAIITLTVSATGTPVLDALALAFTSYPIIFLAGFMLSEPLTLPPRRWQQLALAVVVAVVATSQFSFGPLYASPEFALVVGNLLAFLVGQRRGIRLDFLSRTQLTPTSWEFEFRPQRAVAYSAGQYMELSLPHKKADAKGHRRVFSIASAPSFSNRATSDVVRFGLRIPEKSSSFKRELLALTPGTTISATSVGGDFTLPKDAARPLLMVAGGIGITPFISHLDQLESADGTRDVVLVYSSSRTEEIAYIDRLSVGNHRVLLVAPSEPAAMPATWTYLGAGPLTGNMLLKAVPDATARDAFVSGPPALVSALRGALRKAGVRRVKSDYFSGY